MDRRCLLLLTCLLSSAFGLPVVPTTAPHSIVNNVLPDGSGQFGFQTSDGQVRAETIGPDGSVRGSYSYVDANGRTVTTHYIADKGGFRVAGDHLPQAPSSAVSPISPLPGTGFPSAHTTLTVPQHASTAFTHSQQSAHRSFFPQTNAAHFTSIPATHQFQQAAIHPPNPVADAQIAAASFQQQQQAIDHDRRNQLAQAQQQAQLEQLTRQHQALVAGGPSRGSASVHSVPTQPQAFSSLLQQNPFVQQTGFPFQSPIASAAAHVAAQFPAFG